MIIRGNIDNNNDSNNNNNDGDSESDNNDNDNNSLHPTVTCARHNREKHLFYKTLQCLHHYYAKF